MCEARAAARLVAFVTGWTADPPVASDQNLESNGATLSLQRKKQQIREEEEHGDQRAADEAQADLFLAAERSAKEKVLGGPI